MENHDRPHLAIYAPKDRQNKLGPVRPQKIPDRWLDTEYVIKLNRFYIENTIYGGDALPIYHPNLGLDTLSAIMGCEIEFGENTSWAINHIDNLDSQPEPALDTGNLFVKLSILRVSCFLVMAVKMTRSH